MKDVPFCVDCEHHRERDDGWPARGKDHFCAATSGLDCVTGGPTALCTCREERERIFGCGPFAAAFKRSPAIPDANQGATA